jgi:hypothetical protein
MPSQAKITTYFIFVRLKFGSEWRASAREGRRRETRENYNTEYIKFEVTDFETSYNAILGRPAIAKFMVVPHYTYLVLKMPSPAVVLPLQEGLKISIDCRTRSH